MNHLEEIQRIFEPLPQRDRQVLTSWVRELTEAPEWRVGEPPPPSYGASPNLAAIQRVIAQLPASQQRELCEWLDRKQSRPFILPPGVEYPFWGNATTPELAIALKRFMERARS